MNSNILNTGAQNFISENKNTDIVTVLLKKPIFEGISNKELAQQIESRKKCEKKLPTWFKTPKIYYPKKLNIEQTSSEITADYKASICSGNSLVDLTGGFGVDSYFFSKYFEQILHLEIDEDLSKIASHNFEILGAKNIRAKAQNGIDYLEKTEKNFDCIYLDPARRKEGNQKVFMLSDCTPNILKHLPLLFSKAERVLVKTAPLLDIRLGLSELKHVREIHVVAVENDVKELLWLMEDGYQGKVNIKTINFTKGDTQKFNFHLEEESHATSEFSKAKTYLYEPNSALLKSGAFKFLGQQLGLEKLHEHTHLYTSDKSIEFPGRVFKIIEKIPFNKKSLKALNIKKANITTRNFPETVAQIRKKLRIADGGKLYLFFCKEINQELAIMVCEKVTSEVK
ncbi:class I SAM-dependent methyltransferase [Pseudozobellia sp. WGM2]|uniref:class I SAM-dependent methyltransferase n=1 Tax=Pseudozobellia sp. WGM2 TaxID=2787625 RepID=UPI001ADED716|nr:class I SAM-dependent methyltransferase [Pseudozobellia sp. WGM2]